MSMLEVMTDETARGDSGDGLGDDDVEDTLHGGVEGGSGDRVKGASGNRAKGAPKGDVGDDFEERWEEIVAGLEDFDAELEDLDGDLGKLDGGLRGFDGGLGLPGGSEGGFDDGLDGALAGRFGGTFTDRFCDDVDSDAPFEEPEVVANLRAGPRDWSAPEEEGLDVEDGVDVVELGTLMPIDEEVPEGHPMSRFLWLSAGLLLLMGVLAAFDLAPGGTPLAFAWGAAGFVCAGVAAFLTSPRSEDIDPFDDGARL